MARKKKVEVEKIVPKPFNLEDHLDVSEEAERYDVPEPRAREIMSEVQESGEPVLTIKVTQNETELRERFHRIYNEELRKRRECPFCQEQLASIEQAIAHIRIHLLMSEDLKVARGVAVDIEHQLFPQIEQSITAALGPEERRKLLERIEKRRLLQD